MRSIARYGSPSRGRACGCRRQSAINPSRRRRVRRSGRRRTTPSASAWKLVTRRCRSTGSGHGLDVLQAGVGRPSSAARALAPSTRFCAARGPAPQLRNSLARGWASSLCARVSRASRTAKSTTLSATGTPRTSRCNSRMSSAIDDLRGLLTRGARRAPDDLQFLVPVRVVDPDVEHEAVELRLGQRVGALLLDGILGGEHEEGRGQVVGLAADGHLPLLHGLQQRGLGLGRRAVDLVGQDDVGEHRPLHEAEHPLPGRRCPPRGSRCP